MAQNQSTRRGEACGKPLPVYQQATARYGTKRCAALGWKRHAWEKRQEPGYLPLPIKLPAGTVGAVQELRVCADLLIRGYMVFRAVSPSCSCDLIAMHGSTVLRVEVTTAVYRNDGGIGYHPHDPTAYDVIAAVAHNGRILYSPDLPTDIDGEAPERRSLALDTPGTERNS